MSVCFGEKNWWRYLINDSLPDIMYALFAWCMVNFAWWSCFSHWLCTSTSLLGSNSSTHNLVKGSLFSLDTILPLKYTLHSLLSYVTLHPALHNTAIEISNVWASPGTICALVVLSSSHGMFILHVCVDLITLLSGRFIEIGLGVGSKSTTGVPDNTKCPVVPASATTI